jgi:hypothetical protein
MEHNTLFYGRGDSESLKGVFNPNDISLQNFRFKANDLTYEPKLANLNVEALSFLEKSGFLLQSMTFESRLGDTASKLNNFSFVKKKVFTFNSMFLFNKFTNRIPYFFFYLTTSKKSSKRLL